MEVKVGKIKNLKIDIDTEELEFTIVITDSKFKKQFLRDLNLAGKLAVKGEEIFFLGEDYAEL